MRISGRWAPIALLAALAVLPQAALAQRSPDARPDRAQLEQRIRAQMGRMMQERLGLDEEEAADLSEVVQAFEARRRDLARREFETRRRVEELVRDGGQDRAARELLEAQSELRLEEARLFAEEQEALLEVLTPAQVLQLQDLRQDLGRRIRALRGGPRDRGGNGLGPRGPGPSPDGRSGARAVPGSHQPL